MPDNAIQRLHDQLIRRDIDLLRLSARHEEEFEILIRELTDQLRQELIKVDPTEVSRRFGERRLEKFIKDVDPILTTNYRDIYNQLRNDLKDIAESEIDLWPFFLGSALGLGVNIAERLIAGKRVPRNGTPFVRTGSVRDAIDDVIDFRVFTISAQDADTLQGIMEREAGSHKRRLAGTLRQGFLQDETITQLLGRLRDLTGIQSREMATITRTAYNHAVTQARLILMQQNNHVFRGVIAIAILDGRTSKICISRSRGQWNLTTGRPLPESPVRISFPGPTPWHFGERTQLYPLTRRIGDINRMGNQSVKRELDNLTDAQRQLLSIDPPDDLTYSQWLRRQSADVQRQVLGPSRRSLWIRGEIELTDLVNQKGRALTLEQLMELRSTP